LCKSVVVADGNVDNDVTFIINDFKALVDSGSDIYVVDSTAIHECATSEVLRGENAWD